MKRNKKRARYYPVYLPRDPEVEAAFDSLRKGGVTKGPWAGRAIREKMLEKGLLPAGEAK